LASYQSEQRRGAADRRQHRQAAGPVGAIRDPRASDGRPEKCGLSIWAINGHFAEWNLGDKSLPPYNREAFVLAFLVQRF
jgi:hypothetical protein